MSLPAPPRQCIDLHFEENYSIESSWECKFDNIEVRDGPFGFSPMLGRYCGQHSPPDIRSSGRYLWIKFVTDGELEAVGFSASYNFTAGTTGASLPLGSFGSSSLFVSVFPLNMPCLARGVFFFCCCFFFFTLNITGEAEPCVFLCRFSLGWRSQRVNQLALSDITVAFQSRVKTCGFRNSPLFFPFFFLPTPCRWSDASVNG